MRYALLATSLLLTALLALPAASAEAPPARAACVPVAVGVSCTYGAGGADCIQAQWGVHTRDVVVGGNHGCNATVWVGGGLVDVGAAAAQPCDVQPTWPFGHAQCTVAGKTVGCTFSTGSGILWDESRVSCLGTTLVEIGPL